MKKYTPLWIIFGCYSTFLIFSENFSFETFISVIACIPVIIFSFALAIQFAQVRHFNGLRLIMTGFMGSLTVYFLWLSLSLCIDDTQSRSVGYLLLSPGWRRFVSILPIDFFSYKLYFYLQKIKKS